MIENEGSIYHLLNGKIDTGNSPIASIVPQHKVFQVILTGTGAITATVLLKASLVPDVAGNFLTLKTFSLSGSDRVTDGFAVDVIWPYFQIEVTAITGTSAAVDALVGV